jgi:L-alanine-DL-glutamate epimerase-like enolase superfamily enzyme
MALSLDFRIHELPLRDPFTISRYTVTIQKTMVATVSDGEISGYGEATVNPYYHSTVERLSGSVNKIQPLMASVSGLAPTEFWQKIEPFLRDDYFALCAIDIAYWDYHARKHGQTLRGRWASAVDRSPLTSYTIGLDTIDNMRRKILEMPWPIYKIKLGRKDDLRIVEALRKTTGALFRVDANAAWSAPEATEKARILKDFDVEFIEQPLAAADTEGMKRVKNESALPCIADESCQRFADVLSCAEQFHGINIKLMKCGGITPALGMISLARRKSLSLMAGCMTESTVGISALVQIAPLLDYLDADGALLLARDIAEGVRFDYGKILFSERAGTGVELLEN